MRFALAVVLVGLGANALAWHESGHRVIGILATEQLSPAAKSQVAEILAHLPAPTTPAMSFRYPDVFGSNAGGGVTGAFQAQPSTLETAGPWPDDIRTTWMDRPTWHYINLPIVWGNVSSKAPDPVNAVAAIPKLAAWVANAGNSIESRAAALAWLDHIVGDLHMPLHAVALFSPNHPRGDRGGNDFFLDNQGYPVKENRLHSIWDGMSGKDTAEILGRIRQLATPEPQRVELSNLPKTAMSWAEESKKVAVDWVYTTGGPGSGRLNFDANSFSLSGYSIGRKTISDQRIQLAGLRLAAVINAIFPG